MARLWRESGIQKLLDSLDSRFRGNYENGVFRFFMNAPKIEAITTRAGIDE